MTQLPLIHYCRRCKFPIAPVLVRLGSPLCHDCRDKRTYPESAQYPDGAGLNP